MSASMVPFRERIGIEFISVFGLPPVEFAKLADALGCGHIGIATTPMARLANPRNYPPWSLRRDRSLRQRLKSALQAHHVSISLGEGFIGMPGVDLRASARDLDVMAELGAHRVNFLSVDPDRAAAFDQCALFAQLAGERQLEATLEFLPGLSIGDLATAIAAHQHVNQPHFKLLLDAMHLFRSGATRSDLSALDPTIIGYVQLCDVPRVPVLTDYGDEARHHRLPPGAGELPLSDLLAIVPAHVTIGLEVPMLDSAQAGIGPQERLAGCVRATQALLAA
jgi:sugar phosphate isomerase/epimerase